MNFKRILLKLSGEALMGDKQYGIDKQRIQDYVQDILSAKENGLQIAIVIGGGNIFRGAKDEGVERVQGDYIGMMATIINGLFLQDALQQNGAKVKLLSGIAIDPICESMQSQKAIEYLTNGYIVIISGGTGNPYFTTDTASALRAVEIKADAILKGTRVDGVYSEDPEKNKNAVKFSTISFDEVYEKKLQVMDLTAITLCRENKLPIVVFDMNTKGNLQKIIAGEEIGTIVR